jgi:hypothetical protein
VVAVVVARAVPFTIHDLLDSKELEGKSRLEAEAAAAKKPQTLNHLPH